MRSASRSIKLYVTVFTLLSTKLEAATTLSLFRKTMGRCRHEAQIALRPYGLVVISFAGLQILRCFPLEFVALPDRPPVPQA